jgi:formate dehydrogenase major subunit
VVIQRRSDGREAAFDVHIGWHRERFYPSRKRKTVHLFVGGRHRFDRNAAGYVAAGMAIRRLVPPFLRQLRGDPLGLGRAAQSARSEHLQPRTRAADKVVQSICPYCAVGCGQKVYVKDEKVMQIEGDPDSPISRGRLCPKGSASEKLVNSPTRVTPIKYRRPGATQWEHISLQQATDMIAERIIKARHETWEEQTEDCEPLKRTLDIHFLGGATLDTEETI